MVSRPGADREQGLGALASGLKAQRLSLRASRFVLRHLVMNASWVPCSVILMKRLLARILGRVS